MLLIVALCIGQMKDISPQVLAAARVVLDNPDNKVVAIGTNSCFNCITAISVN
jgi:hypothetical protein